MLPRDRVPRIPGDWHGRRPASMRALQHLQDSVPIRLPPSYLAFLRCSNGGEGTIRGRDIVLWRAEEVHLRNDDLAVYRWMPGSVAIGTDGGGYGYLIDGRRHDGELPILRTHLGELDFECADLAAPSFADLVGLV